MLLLAHDVDQADLVGEADLVEHLPEVRGRRGVHERRVPFGAHGADHAQRREGIDEAGGALGRLGARGQDQALHGFDAAILGVHGAAEDRDGLAQQRLRGGRRAGLDDDPRPFVADGQGLIQASGDRFHRRRRNPCGHHRPISRAGRRGRAQIGPGKEQALIGRVDGRGLEAHDHLLRLWLRCGDADQRELEGAVLLRRRTKLQSRACGCHVSLPPRCGDPATPSDIVMDVALTVPDGDAHRIGARGRWEVRPRWHDQAATVARRAQEDGGWHRRPVDSRASCPRRSWACAWWSASRSPVTL